MLFMYLDTCITDKVMDAVEVAERRSLAATSNVVAGAVSKRYGLIITISRKLAKIIVIMHHLVRPYN